MNPIITHSIFAAIITLIFSIGGYEAIGFWVVSTFYYSRELNQYQTEKAKELGVFRSTLWNVWWPKGHESQFLIPSVLSLILALTIRELL